LCVWRDKKLVTIRDFSNVKPFDTLLYLEPLRQAYEAVEAEEHETIAVQGSQPM